MRHMLGVTKSHHLSPTISRLSVELILKINFIPTNFFYEQANYVRVLDYQMIHSITTNGLSFDKRSW